MRDIFGSPAKASHEPLADKDPLFAVSAKAPFLHPHVTPTVHDINSDAGEERIWHDMPADQWMFAMVRSGNGDGWSYKGLSMGEIGAAVYKSNPQKYGQVKKVCADGLCFDYIGNPLDDAGPAKMDILAPHLNIYMENIAFEVISDVEIQNPLSFDLFPFRQMMVRFAELSACRKRLWDRFVRNVAIYNLSLEV